MIEFFTSPDNRSCAQIGSQEPDGNTNGNTWNNAVSWTREGQEAWWQVALGAVQSLNTITMWNRTDVDSNRLSTFYVLVSDTPFSSNGLNTAHNQSGVASSSVVDAVGTNTSVTMSRSGRYGRMELAGKNYLTLAEVQITGN